MLDETIDYFPTQLLDVVDTALDQIRRDGSNVRHNNRAEEGVSRLRPIQTEDGGYERGRVHDTQDAHRLQAERGLTRRRSVRTERDKVSRGRVDRSIQNDVRFTHGQNRLDAAKRRAG